MDRERARRKLRCVGREELVGGGRRARDSSVDDDDEEEALEVAEVREWVVRSWKLGLSHKEKGRRVSYHPPRTHRHSTHLNTSPASFSPSLGTSL